MSEKLNRVQRELDACYSKAIADFKPDCAATDVKCFLKQQTQLMAAQLECARLAQDQADTVPSTEENFAATLSTSTESGNEKRGGP